MGIRSEVLFSIEFEKEYKDQVASRLKAILLDDKFQEFNIVLPSIIKEQNNSESTTIKFYFYEDWIKYSAVEEEFNFIINKIEEINTDSNSTIIKYELMELCTEFIDENEFGEHKTNKDYYDFKVNASISADISIDPCCDEPSLLEWLKNN